MLFAQLILVSLSKFLIIRPFLWGPAALEQYKLKQEVGWLLWKQPGTQEVIELLDRGMLDHSTKEFPLDLELEVNTGILLTYCLRTQ